MLRRVFLISVFALCADAFADDAPASPPPPAEQPAVECVVTADRIETPRDEVASSITVIGADEIAERQATQVYDVLRNVPGVDVVRSGGLGGNTAIFLRGANPEHTLVLIDGVEVNDPISTSGAFNFSDLTLDNVERIEVLRGPQSTLYGSNALGGVINIITKKGSGPATAEASFEGGSYNTYTEKASASGGTEVINYSLGVTRQDSGGFSAADSELGNTERDGFANTGFSGRVGVTPDKDTELALMVRGAHSKSDIDASGGRGGDDPNEVFRNSEYFTRLQLTSAFFDGTVKPTIGISYYDDEYKDDNDPDPISMDFLRSTFHGSRLKLDLQNEWDAAPWLAVVTGVETQQERGDSYDNSISSFGPFDDRFPESSARNNGYYAQVQGKFGGFFFPTAGVRLDSYTGFDEQVTYRLAPVFLIKETGTKIFSTVGTAFKAPSLFERYSEFGDPTLLPEKSIGVDAGVEQRLFSDRLSGGVTYFNNHFDHLIEFNPDTFFFQNIDRARTEGLETFVEAQPIDRWTLRADYTLTNAEDLTTHTELLRRAKHKAGASVRYAFSDRGMVRLDFTYVGKRKDDDFSTPTTTLVTLGGYPLVGINASYSVMQNVDLFLRIENLFNHKYEEVVGYGTPRTSAFGGVKVSL